MTNTPTPKPKKPSAKKEKAKGPAEKAPLNEMELRIAKHVRDEVLQTIDPLLTKLQEIAHNQPSDGTLMSPLAAQLLTAHQASAEKVLELNKGIQEKIDARMKRIQDLMTMKTSN